MRAQRNKALGSAESIALRQVRLTNVRAAPADGLDDGASKRQRRAHENTRWRKPETGFPMNASAGFARCSSGASETLTTL